MNIFDAAHDWTWIVRSQCHSVCVAPWTHLETESARGPRQESRDCRRLVEARPDKGPQVRADIDTRIANEGRVPLTPLVRVHELQNGGVVMNDGQMKVTATLVDHPPVVPAFAYRFDAPERSIVISGDTAPSTNLVALATGADVLVHSVMYPPAIDRLGARVPNAAALKASILAHQTSAEDAGRVARDAGVKTLVLSHFVPPDDPSVTDAMWLEAARRHFRGPVIIGKDLLEI